MRRLLWFAPCILSLASIAIAQQTQPSKWIPKPGPPFEADYDDDGGDSKLMSSIALPVDFSLDYALGLQKKARRVTTIHSGGLYDEGQAVLVNLVSSPKVSGLPYQWSFGIDPTQVVNAFSLPDGTLGVNEPLGKMLMGSPGLWAAVLSHEVEHTAMRHGARLYLYEQNFLQQLRYYELRVANGDKNANWAILGLRIGYAIGVKKLSREQEHDADKQGMLLMARAGYHPDFAFALHKMMASNMGDQGKFAAFFSDHPRWATRDQRSQKAFDKALSVYNQMWPDPSESPGGPPPTVAFMGKPNSEEDKQNHVARLHVPLYCRNTKEPIFFSVFFLDGNGNTPSGLLEEYKTPDGGLAVLNEVKCPTSPGGSIEVTLPSGAVMKNQRKLKAEVRIFDSSHRLIEMSKPFEVKLPKQ